MVDPRNAQIPPPSPNPLPPGVASLLLIEPPLIETLLPSAFRPPPSLAVLAVISTLVRASGVAGHVDSTTKSGLRIPVGDDQVREPDIAVLRRKRP